MKRWQKAVITALILVLLLTLWLLDAFTTANAHRLWRAILLLFTVLVLPAPLAAAGYAAYGERGRWFRYGVAGILAAVTYPVLNLVLFLLGMIPLGTYRFIPAPTLFLVGVPPEAISTGSGTTLLFLIPTLLRVAPLAALPLTYHFATDARDRHHLFTITAAPALIAVFWLATLLLTLAGLCAPVCGLAQ